MKSFSTYKLLLAFILALFPAFMLDSIGQVKEKGVPFIKHYEKQEYGGGTQNWDFVQTENRVLYVANKQGVIRFDGQEWSLIPMPNLSVVSCLFRDDDDTIFVGAFDEFGYLKPDSTGELSYVSLMDNIPDIEPGEFRRIRKSGNRLYFQSYNCLIIHDKEKGQWDVIKPERSFDFLHEVGDKMYINNRGVGLMEVGESKLIGISGGDFFAEDEIFVMTEVNSVVIVGAQNNGLFTREGDGFYAWNTEVNNFLLRNKLYSFAQTEENLFWGSIQDGLVVTDNHGKIISHLNKNRGLNNNTVLSLFIDFEENLWLGLDNGIDQVFIHSPLSKIQTSAEIGAGYSASLFMDRIYLGTNQGLYWIESDLGLKSQDNIPITTSIPECTGQVWSMEVFGDELLIAHNRGTFAIDKNHQVRQLYDKSGTWNFFTIPGDNEHILQGTYEGIIVYDRGLDGINFNFKVEGFSESSRTVFAPQGKTIWMGHGYKGIYQISLSNDLSKAEEIRLFGESSGLTNQHFNELFYPNKSILVGNYSGLYKYDAKIEDFEPAEYWNRAFQSGQRITRLIEYRPGNYFYFQDGSSGQLQIFADTLFIKNEGILAPINHAFISAFENVSDIGQQELLIGTDDGFAHLDLNVELSKSDEIPFQFKKVLSLRKESDFSVNLEFAGDLSEKNDTHPLRSIPYRDNDLRIVFSASYLTEPQETEYQYFLDGWSDAWSSWSSTNSIDFTNLREGEYLLRIKARNVYRTISSENKLLFRILTPWHKSIVAYLSYLLVIILGAMIVWKVINDKLKRETRRTKILEERRMLHQQLKLKKDSEQAEQEIIKLRNDRLRASIRHKSKELANQTMGVLQKNQFLTEMKEEMISLKKKAQSDEVKNSLHRMLRKIDRNIEDENVHKVFETNFDQVHENFLYRLREAFPELTAKDLRLCAYLRLNLSSKEIAPLLNISVRGVEISRYRLRKKLSLDHDEKLADFILRF